MAKRAFHDYVIFIYDFMAKPSAFGCPVSCTQSVFDINVKYFHENAFIQTEEEQVILYNCILMVVSTERIIMKESIYLL